MSKDDFLFMLFNKGHVDMRLAYNYFVDGELRWSRWVRYDYLISLELTDWVKGTKDTRESFIAKCSHRTIHPFEIVYDVDGVGVFSSIKEKTLFIYKYLPRAYCDVYFTGNKSFHIHQSMPGWSFLSRQQRFFERERLLVVAGADVQKASEGSMIAIEGEPHYRSGLLKSIVNLEEGDIE